MLTMNQGYPIVAQGSSKTLLCQLQLPI